MQHVWINFWFDHQNCQQLVRRLCEASHYHIHAWRHSSAAISFRSWKLPHPQDVCSSFRLTEEVSVPGYTSNGTPRSTDLHRSTIKSGFVGVDSQGEGFNLQSFLSQATSRYGPVAVSPPSSWLLSTVGTMGSRRVRSCFLSVQKTQKNIKHVWCVVCVWSLSRVNVKAVSRVGSTCFRGKLWPSWRPVSDGI